MMHPEIISDVCQVSMQHHKLMHQIQKTKRQIQTTEFSYSVVSSSAGRGAVATEDTEGRVALAKEIGDFVVRSLDGQHRGSSGWSRLNLASRLYVIFADFEGVRFAPPRVVRTFAEAAALCKRGASCGAAIFVGFPSQWEARIAVERTGLVWPNPVL